MLFTDILMIILLNILFYQFVCNLSLSLALQSADQLGNFLLILNDIHRRIIDLFGMFFDAIIYFGQLILEIFQKFFGCSEIQNNAQSVRENLLNIFYKGINEMIMQMECNKYMGMVFHSSLNVQPNNGNCSYIILHNT